MAAESLNTFESLVAHILSHLNEPEDGTSGWDDDVREIVVKQARRLYAFYGWISLEKHPPAILIVPQLITDATVTIAAGGTAGTFGGPAANYAATKLGWKFRPSGADYYLRISVHTAASTAFTSPGAPVALTASAGRLYQDEIDLPSDFKFLLNAAWSNAGVPIPIISDETLRDDHREPTAEGWPATAAALIGATRLRFSSVPSDAKKIVEVPYTYDPGDPSGTSTLAIESSLRTLLAQMCYGPAWRLKRSFAQATTEEQLAIRQMEEAKDAEERKRRPIAGNISSSQRRAAYA